MSDERDPHGTPDQAWSTPQSADEAAADAASEAGNPTEVIPTPAAGAAPSASDAPTGQSVTGGATDGHAAEQPTVATPAGDLHGGLFATDGGTSGPGASDTGATAGAGSGGPDAIGQPAPGHPVEHQTTPIFPPPADASGAATGAGIGATAGAIGGAGAGAATGTAAQPAPARKGGVLGKAIAVGAAAGLVAGLAGGYAGARLGSDTETTSTGSSLSNSEPNNSGDLSPRATDTVSAIADKILPSVVSIGVTSGSGSGTGSGFIIREDGFILTNNHVVESAANGGEITVTFDNQEQKKAEIAGRSPEYDLALLKVDASGLPAVTLGDSETVKVGDTAIAVGSPLGLAGTVTSGIISALDRPVTAGSGQGNSETSMINAIQTDASINPGNSGGPLVNGEGQVIGVNSAIASNTGGSTGQAGSIGLGFAIPINTAKRVAEELIKSGKSETPIIGATIDGRSTTVGAKVAQVVPNGPGAKAGLKDGDLITAVNGEPISDQADLITTIRSFAPGQQITLTVDRGGQKQEITVTLGVKDSQQ